MWTDWVKWGFSRSVSSMWLGSHLPLQRKKSCASMNTLASMGRFFSYQSIKKISTNQRIKELAIQYTLPTLMLKKHPLLCLQLIPLSLKVDSWRRHLEEQSIASSSSKRHLAWIKTVHTSMSIQIIKKYSHKMICIRNICSNNARLLQYNYLRLVKSLKKNSGINRSMLVNNCTLICLQISNQYYQLLNLCFRRRTSNNWSRVLHTKTKWGGTRMKVVWLRIVILLNPKTKYNQPIGITPNKRKEVEVKSIQKEETPNPLQSVERTHLKKSQRKLMSLSQQ